MTPAINHELNAEEPRSSEVKRPDSQGRISLGKELADQSFSVERRGNGDILLRPVTMIHAAEAWLLKNPAALEAVKRGLAQSEAGQIQDAGDFKQYLAEDDDTEE